MRYKKTVLLFLSAFVLIISSCKKKYACQCATTYSKTGYQSFTVSSIEEIDSKTTKKTAEHMCLHAEKQMTKNDADYISGNEKVTISCAVK